MAGEMDLARIVNFDSFRAYRRLLAIAGPDARLYDYLETQGVNLKHVISPLHGAIARQPYNFDNRFGLAEDAVALPVLEPNDETPLDVVVCSMDRPPKFVCLLELGGVLGANAVVNPATYAGGKSCKLVRTPLQWLKAGIQGHAVVLDPVRARPLLDQAPGDLAAEDLNHARQLVRSGAVEAKRLVIPVEAAA